MIYVQPRTNAGPLWQFISPCMAVMAAVLIAFFCLELGGLAGSAIIYDFFIAPLADDYMRVEILGKASPLILCALGLALCYQANIWNIGAEGQFIVGAIAASAIALHPPELGYTVSVLCITAAGMAAGLLWSSITAGLKVWLGVSEILTTIMLNYVALHLLAFMVNGPLRNPDGFNFPESALFTDEVMLPSLHPDYFVTSGILVSLVLAALFWLLHARSLYGFKLRLLGQDPTSLAFLRTRSAGLVMGTMAVGGACAGLAGALEMIGPVGQLTMHVGFGFGYTAIVVAFLGRLHPVAIVVAGFVLSLTYIGGENLQINHELPEASTSIFQGALLLCLLSTDALTRYQIRLRASPDPATS